MQGRQWLGWCCLAWALPLGATPVSVVLQADQGDTARALVSLHAADGQPLSEVDRVVQMDQVDRQFRPRAIAVQKGGEVRFLNNDDVRHHVYSFSQAKRFELPLYEGDPPEDIRFETAGEVVLGCNIHDWMVGWVHVMDTPHFAFAGEAGRVEFQVAPGDYELRVWHPALRDENRRLMQPLSVADQPLEEIVTLELEAAGDDNDGLERRGRDRF